MKRPTTPQANIPPGLQPYFQEYDMLALDLHRDANPINQPTLEFGTGEEVRWVIDALGNAPTVM